jgi:hypothetical protein
MFNMWGHGAMQGVILWCDPDKGKAVIWCEDHGQLAYYNDHGLSMIPFAFDVGDLVIFEQEQRDGLRYAHDMRLVASQEYPALADQLGRTNKVGQRVVAKKEPALKDSGRVIVFRRKEERQSLALA